MISQLNYENLCDDHKAVIFTLHQCGFSPMFVGGCVRDALLNGSGKPKDLDIEVYGTGLDEVILKLQDVHHIKRCDLVGESFSACKVFFHSGVMSMDINVARKERKVGVGHKGFDIEIGISDQRESALRRDFTINAMSYDPMSSRFFDFFGGVDDFKNGILKAVSGHFAEDPLRILRGMQFASRFGLKATPETIKMCRDVAHELKYVSKERIWIEWEKWATKLGYKDYGINFITDIGGIYPEIDAMKGCPQDPRYHPEGDVLTHVLAMLRMSSSCLEPAILLAVLLHDVGKPSTTTVDDDAIRSIGHDVVGYGIAGDFIASIGAPNIITEKVMNLVRYHMYQVNNRSSVLWLSELIYPATVREWRALRFLDKPNGSSNALWIDHSDPCYNGRVPDILMGRHLIKIGVEPGPKMGEILKYARQAQLNDRFQDLDGAYEWLKKYCPEVRFVNGNDLIQCGLKPGPHFSTRIGRAFDAQLNGASKEEALKIALED